MLKEKVPESELQKWFEKAARNRVVCSAIGNMGALQLRLDFLKKQGNDVDRTTRDGLSRAQRVCQVLTDCDLLIADNSIAPAGCRQLRPDLVLVSDGADYVLIELKTKAAAERQGVQELLAYSTGIKMQAPYVNEFIYVIVADAWGASLEYSVRSLILDGKHVLPLQWVRNSLGEFELRILLELFEFNFVQPYDPLYAMVPATLTISRPRDVFRRHVKDELYFRKLALSLIAECERKNQTGFVLIHSAPWTSDEEILKLTLVTVNQNWRSSEYLPTDYRLFQQMSPSGFAGTVRRKARSHYRATYKKLMEYEHADDLLAHATASERVMHFHPQSTLSYDLIKRHRDYRLEKAIEDDSLHQSTYCISNGQNLSGLLDTLDIMTVFETVEPFKPFGELADFARKSKSFYPQESYDLKGLLNEFCVYKMSAEGG